MTSGRRVNMKCNTSTVDASVISNNFVGSERLVISRKVCQFVLTGQNDKIILKYQFSYPSNHTVVIPFKLFHF